MSLDRLRIVHITASMQMGGAEQCLFHLVRTLRVSCDQTVITFRDGMFVQRISELGVPVIVVPYGPLFFWRLFRVVRRQRPEVMHALLWSSGFVARVLGKLLHVPVVYAIHSPVNSDGYDAWWRSLADRLTLAWASQVILVSPRISHERALAVPHVVIPNGVDGEFVRARVSALCAEQEQGALHCGITDGHFVIGTVGRLVALKNHSLLLQVLARLYPRYPQLRLLIVGEGPLFSVLQQQAWQLGIGPAVHWVRGDACQYYPLFDLFVLPSHVEGLSMALLEAMSCGIPAIASRTASQGVLDGSTGAVFSADNPAELEGLLVRAIEDVAWRKNLSHAGLAAVKRDFSFERVATEYYSVFRRLCRRI